MTLAVDSDIFLQITDSSRRRVLRPARVVGARDDVFTAALEEDYDEDLAAEACRDFLVLFQHEQKFLQQSATVVDVFADGQTAMLTFKTTGEPVSAENRQCYRVSAFAAGLTVELGDEPDCPLLDVSCTGFSVFARRNRDIGSVIDAVFSFESVEYAGQVCVQGRRPSNGGRIRYGLHCVENTCSEGRMPHGLLKMSVSLQREQLRRLAGTT